MQTVSDIIRHYSGAGKGGVDVMHRCEGSKRNGRLIGESQDGWELEVTAVTEGSLEDVEIYISINYCPWCGAKLVKH